MTVRELIEKLQGMPQDLPVFTLNSCADNGLDYYEVGNPDIHTTRLNFEGTPDADHLPLRNDLPQITFVQL